MKKLFIKFLKHELISGSLFLFIGAIIGSFLSFLYNLFLARTLTQVDYGTYTSLLSFETLIIIPSASLSAVIVRFATHYFAKGEEEKAAHLFRRMSIVWLIVGALASLIIYLFRPFLLNYLHLKDPLLITVVALGIGISYIGVVNTGFLQSLLKFPFMSFTAIAGGAAKIIIGGVLVLMGAKAVGGLIGVLMLPLAGYLLAFWPLRNLLGRRSGVEEKIETREILSYAGFAALGVLALSSFISSDMILVKHFFNDTQAGMYGGLSIIGKVIFYFTSPIGSVMFPLLIKKHGSGQNFKNTFYLSMILVFVPSVGITLFYFLFPSFTANLFLGKNYLGVVPYLGLFGIFITVFNMVNIITNYFLSMKKTNVSFLIFAFAILQIVLIYLFHSDFYHVIFSSIISLSLLLLTLLLYYKLQKD